MAKTNPFQQFTESITAPIGGAVRGIFRGLAPGMAKQHDLDKQRMQALLESEKGQRLLRSSQIAMNESRASSLNRGEGLYGGRGVDPYVKGAEDLGKIRTARDKFLTDELAPETAAYFTAAEKSVLDRMKATPTDNRDYFAPEDETDVFTALGKKKKKEPSQGPMTRDEWNKSSVEERQKSRNEAFGVSDYFQASTDTVPESNVPKSYKQLGITDINDQATLEEMQKALPDVDMKSEYEGDPEMMKKLIELWRNKKLTKQNLHKAFSMLQQTAQQALGLG